MLEKRVSGSHRAPFSEAVCKCTQKGRREQTFSILFISKSHFVSGMGITPRLASGAEKGKFILRCNSLNCGGPWVHYRAAHWVVWCGFARPRAGLVRVGTGGS